MPHSVKAGKVVLGRGRLFLIGGPCVLESRDLAFRVCEGLQAVCAELDIAYVFKASYDKANRTSVKSFRGPGPEEGLELLARVAAKFGVPVLTDVHSPDEAEKAARAVDVLQVPAFLCRQTDLLLACGETGLPVNVKKGQFMAPWDMRQVVDKIRSTDNSSIMLCERGSSFGYNNLVVDMRGLAVMKSFGYPVVFDGSHSVQLPGAGASGQSSGGERAFAPHLIRAALAAGADGLFLETHPHPEKALCDGPNMLPLSEMKGLLAGAKRVFEAVRAD
ncbi:MAG TPA: 3-deoxy-8-phosphooctulonate synthase [Planctomycetota bacterium]|nr:3-deoxy-8-phosphooctulonate synthase [Planctomycetota bacterium]